MPSDRNWLNRLLIALAIAGVALTFMFQEFSFVQHWEISEDAKFVVRKIIRVVLNDFFMLILIAAWFRDWRVTRLAILVQLIDSLVLLPTYLVLKLALEGNSEISMPLLSLLHRLIVNPTLMILLLPALYFQRLQKH